MNLNWKQCIICQTDTSEPLKCPLDSLNTTRKTDAYSSFLENVQQFRDLNALPITLYFDSDVTASEFEINNASWHKSCHLKFNNTKLSRARKRSLSQESDCVRMPSKRLRKAFDFSNCLFCDKGQEEGDLHLVSTFDTHSSIRLMVTELQDTALLARIVGGDLIAIEAKYHLKCLVNLKNRYRSCSRKAVLESEKEGEKKLNESRAFVELSNYIERSLYSGTLFFKLSELHTLYVNRLEDLGIEKEINKSRLKLQLLEHFPEAQEQYDGRNIVIVFKKGMESMLRDAIKKRDFSEDVEILAKAAKIIRNDIFDQDWFKFNGCFPPECQEDSLPTSLKSLVSLILSGPNLKDQDKRESQACLTISQLIFYNVKKRSSDSTVKVRHTLAREPPLPSYIGLNIHQLTRSRKIVQQLHKMGMCISYDRVIEVEDWIATSTCQRFREEGVVSPACLRKGLFTVGALDNIDHNLSATTSLSSSFHGTGISLFQFPTKEKLGESRTPVTIPPPNGAKHHSLPYHYAFVPAVALTTTKVSVPRFNIAPVLVSETIAPLSNTADSTLVPAPLSNTADSTLVPAPLSNTADSTLVPAPLSNTADSTLVPAPLSNTADSTLVPAPLSNTADSTLVPAPLSNTDDSALVPAPLSNTADSTLVPAPLSNTDAANPLIEAAKARENSWIMHALTLLKEELSRKDAIAWAAYHALQQTPAEDPPALCALMPLFYEKAATPAMVRHGMNVQRQAIEYLNPGQIPVTVFDQPLFALAKYVQWKWPDTHGESVYVVMLGGLHTEMALWSTLGDILEESGWTTALVEAEIASSGTADSFLKVSHLTRTRHAHQLTLLTLHKLQQEAFAKFEGNSSADDWRKEMVKRSPTFMFWDLVMRYETLILIFIRAHRERNFSLYVEVLEKLTPLFFALDHVNYSRWMLVIVNAMKNNMLILVTVSYLIQNTLIYVFHVFPC